MQKLNYETSDQWNLRESNDFSFENYKSFISLFLTRYKKIKNDKNKSGWLIVDLESNNLNAINWCKYRRIKINQSMRLLQTITWNVIGTPQSILARINDLICRISNVVIAACQLKEQSKYISKDYIPPAPLLLAAVCGLSTQPQGRHRNRGFCNFFCKGAPI